jgi:hypothetical protein
VRYIIRLNKRAINPLTQQLNPKRRWEVEQRADKDSEKVVWHCEDVRIGDTPVQALFKMPEPPKTVWDWELHFVGTVARGQDNFVVILGVPDGERD